MSTFTKLLAAVALSVATYAAVPGAAQARYWHHHHHYGFYGWGFAPYAYYPPAFYGPPCHWVRVRVWRHGRWYWRNERRCD